jgi:hypothetical protein
MTEHECAAYDSARCSADPYGYTADLVHLKGREIGVALSGGGTRAAVAALGEFRALHHLKWKGSKARWIDQVKYVSAVSGGAWFAVPYTFLPDTSDNETPNTTNSAKETVEGPTPAGSRADDTFLGAYRDPSKIDEDSFKHNSNGTFSLAVSKTRDFEHSFGKYYRVSREEAYGRAVADVLLAPFGLNHQKKMFTSGLCSAEFLAAQGDLERDDFVLPHKNRPFLIANSSLLAKGALLPNSGDFYIYPLDVTPLYTGIRPSSECSRQPGSQDTWRFGGGYMDSMGFGTHVTSEPDFRGAESVTSAEIKFLGPKARFTLSDVMGTSGAAPVETITKVHILPASAVGFPVYLYSPIGSAQWSSQGFVFGDGEHTDNLAITALLARRVEKIIAFVNTMHPLCKRGEPKPDDLEKAIARLGRCELPHGDGYLDDLRALFGALPRKTKVQVFRTHDLDLVMDGLAERVKQGRSAVHCQQHEVLNNVHQGIVGRDYKPTICWVYLESSKNWVTKLSVDTCLKGDIARGESPVESFPHYETMLQEPVSFLDLDTVAINALADYTSWSVVSAADEIRDAFDRHRAPAPASHAAQATPAAIAPGTQTAPAAPAVPSGDTQ